MRPHSTQGQRRSARDRTLSHEALTALANRPPVPPAPRPVAPAPPQVPHILGGMFADDDWASGGATQTLTAPPLRRQHSLSQPPPVSPLVPRQSSRAKKRTTLFKPDHPASRWSTATGTLAPPQARKPKVKTTEAQMRARLQQLQHELAEDDRGYDHGREWVGVGGTEHRRRVAKEARAHEKRLEGASRPHPIRRAPYDDKIDFDGASKAWRKNKLAGDEGDFRYRQWPTTLRRKSGRHAHGKGVPRRHPSYWGLAMPSVHHVAEGHGLPPGGVPIRAYRTAAARDAHH